METSSGLHYDDSSNTVTCELCSKPGQPYNIPAKYIGWHSTSKGHRLRAYKGRNEDYLRKLRKKLRKKASITNNEFEWRILNLFCYLASSADLNDGPALQLVAHYLVESWRVIDVGEILRHRSYLELRYHVLRGNLSEAANCIKTFNLNSYHQLLSREDLTNFWRVGGLCLQAKESVGPDLLLKFLELIKNTKIPRRFHGRHGKWYNQGRHGKWSNRERHFITLLLYKRYFDLIMFLLGMGHFDKSREVHSLSIGLVGSHLTSPEGKEYLSDLVAGYFGLACFVEWKKKVIEMSMDGSSAITAIQIGQSGFRELKELANEAILNLKCGIESQFASELRFPAADLFVLASMELYAYMQQPQEAIRLLDQCAQHQACSKNLINAIKLNYQIHPDVAVSSPTQTVQWKKRISSIARTKIKAENLLDIARNLVEQLSEVENFDDVELWKMLAKCAWLCFVEDKLAALSECVEGWWWQCHFGSQGLVTFSADSSAVMDYKIVVETVRYLEN